MEANAERLMELKNQIEVLKTKKARAEGSLKQIQKNMEELFGLADEGQAIKILENKKKELEKVKRELEKLCNQIEVMLNDR